MLGKIVFTYFKSVHLDINSKKWRLFADILNDVALFIDIFSCYIRNYFIICQCISCVMKTLVGTIGGATRASLIEHHARNNNMCDISAKDESQETCINLLALLISLALIPAVVSSEK